jgi:hypothetical protein
MSEKSHLSKMMIRNRILKGLRHDNNTEILTKSTVLLWRKQKNLCKMMMKNNQKMMPLLLEVVLKLLENLDLKRKELSNNSNSLRKLVE